ncbi:MAG: peptidylprolyl isomerase [Candidatus Thermoplasmatota archaeon]
MEVKKGDKVKVEYTGRLEDGTVFDSSDNHDQPLEFTAGGGQVIKGFDEAVIGMEKGEKKEITLEPEEAYGEHQPDLIKKMPRENFNVDQEIEPGMTFIMKLPDGRQIPATIKDTGEENVTIDLNPPLAGKTLTFDIKILDVTKE